ncbi:MAG: hypothetical protein ABI339_08050 [Solirubrobacteraceae bacterium]
MAHSVIFNLPYILVAAVLSLGVVFDLGPGDAPVAVGLAAAGVVLVTLAVAVALVNYARHQTDQPRGRWRRLGSEVVQAIPEGLRETRRRVPGPRLLLAAIAYWAGDCDVLAIGFHAVHGSAPLGLSCSPTWSGSSAMPSRCPAVRAGWSR